MQNNKSAITYGVIAGLIYCVLSTVSWVMGTSAYTGFMMIYTWVPVIFILMLVGAFQERKAKGGYASFKEILRFVFLAYITYEVIYMIYYVLLYQIIDTSLSQKVLQESLEKTRAFMEKMGASETDIDKAMDKAREQGETSIFQQVFLGFGLALVFDFIKAAIIAAIVKKEKEADQMFS